ncbi:hypothetical protein HNQ44_001030 [Planomicrobium koreense]|jgi:hypothetical protein|uniref:Uncharacterized protein n=1 Tax=Planococcus koreensis TaxID=112331 RepID=A0A7W8FT21_9BACL|nr:MULTISPECIES: hypothetical protein [Planococcus]MBB5179606.1 hypothetical protein [Planococcus koreensis]MDN3448752.1 hypothetical protein [Planococcus sp. APC 3906]
MQKKLNELSLQLASSVQAKVANERGSQTLEWIGIAAVIVIVVGVVSQAFAGGGFGDTLVSKFEGFISKIGGGA